MREGGVPGGPDDIRAGFPAFCAAVVPPGRVGVASQPRQRAVDGAGGDQAVEEGIAQFVVQGALGNLEQQLVEQRGGGRVDRVVAVPGRQLLDQALAFGVVDHLAQDRQQGCEQARRVAGAIAELQRAAVVQVPFGAAVGQLGIQPLAAVRQVVVAGNRPAIGRDRLEVGGDDVAARRVFLLWVVGERIEAGLVRLALAAVEDEARVHSLRPLRQGRRGPPADIAGGIGPDQVESWRMDLRGRRAGLGQGIGAIQLVEGVEHRVLGLEESPPHGDRGLAGAGAEGVVDDRTVGRAAQGELHRRSALDRDFLLLALQVDPFALVPDLVGVVRVDLLGDQVEVVVLEHRQAPAERAVVAQRGEGVERLVVAIEFETGRAQLGLVPYRRRGEADMRVAGQQGLAAGGAAAGDDPGVAALELRQAGVLQGLLAETGEGAKVLPVAGAQCAGGRQHALRMPVEIEDAQVVAAQFVADVGQHRLGAEGGGEAVGHVAGDAQGVFGGEGTPGYAQQVEFERRRVVFLELVDPVQVGLQHLPGLRLLVLAGAVFGGVVADAQGAEQTVGIHQLGSEHFGQLAARQAPQHFHLEQAVLGVHVAEGAVEVGLVLRIQVRNPALVVAHVDRRLQVGQGERAVAERLLGMEVPGAAGSRGGDRHGDHGQGAFHRSFLLVVVPSILRMPPARGIDRMLGPWKSLVNREEPPCRTTRLPAP